MGLIMLEVYHNWSGVDYFQHNKADPATRGERARVNESHARTASSLASPTGGSPISGVGHRPARAYLFMSEPLPLVTYHGVLAPAASLRPHIVPDPPQPPPGGCAHHGGQEASLAKGKPSPSKGKRRRYYPWAELVARVWSVDVLVCSSCGGPCKVLTFLTDPAVVRRILAHLGLPTEPPRVAPARGPPQTEIDFS